MRTWLKLMSALMVAVVVSHAVPTTANLHTLTPEEIMARLVADQVLAVITVWQEAEGEDFDGKTMVAEVILNRMKRKAAPVPDIVLAAKQFSEWNENDLRSKRSLTLDDDDAVVQDCIKAWNRAIQGSKLAKGATHYHADYVQPYWASSMKLVARRGKHLFYVES